MSRSRGQIEPPIDESFSGLSKPCFSLAIIATIEVVCDDVFNVRKGRITCVTPTLTYVEFFCPQFI